MNTLAFILLLPLLAFSAEPVVHRLPAAASVFPQGSQPGAVVDAEILGEYLDRAKRIVFEDEQLTASIESVAPTRLQIRVRVSAKANYGPHYFRIVSPRGASGPALFRIGDLPRARDTEPNSTLSQAQPVPTPVTIDGRLNVDGDFDFYRFSAKAGESWIFDLRAARNGNSLDSALILLDSTGRKLAHSEDQFIWDPFLLYKFSNSGEYVVVVQPTHARNDPNFAYELDIRQAPHLQTVAPISMLPGTKVDATLFGAGLAGQNPRLEFDEPGLRGEVLSLGGATAQLRLDIPAGARTGVHAMALWTAAGRSNSVRFLVDPTPQQQGAELKAPVSIDGIARYREPARFTLDAKQGETLVFEVRAGRFGSPVDSMLRLIDDKGKLIASNDDFTFIVADFYNKDSRLSHTFKQDGHYTLELRNMVATGGENFPYQLRVTPPEPRFELSLADEHPYIYPGKEAKLKITATRRDGHKDAIDLQLTGLPAGITAEPAIIPADKNEAEILLKAAPDVKPGESAHLKIAAAGQQAWKPVRISSGGGEGATFASIDKALLVVAEKPSFSLEAAATAVSLPKGTSAVIPVMIRREPAFQESIDFRLENLPAGVILEKATAAPDQDRIDLRVRAAADAPQGRAARVSILGIAGREQQEAPRITIQVD